MHIKQPLLTKKKSQHLIYYIDRRTLEANELLDDCMADDMSLMYVGFTTSS